MRTMWHVWVKDYDDGIYIPVTAIAKAANELVARGYASEITRAPGSAHFGKSYIVTTVPNEKLIRNYFWQKKFTACYEPGVFKRYFCR